MIEMEILDPTGARLTSAIVNGRCKLRLTMPQALRSGDFADYAQAVEHAAVLGGKVPAGREPALV